MQPPAQLPKLSVSFDHSLTCNANKCNIFYGTFER
jgi:hypothetical protein